MESLEKAFYKSAKAKEKALKTYEQSFNINNRIAHLENKILELRSKKEAKIQKYHKELTKAQQLEETVNERIESVALLDCVEHTSEEIREAKYQVILKLEKVTGIIHK